MSVRVRRWRAALGAAALALVSAAVAPATADAAPHHDAQHHYAQHHYYVEIGGTGAQAPVPDCTRSFYYANQQLHGGIPVPVCYPASGGPFVGSHNEMPAPLAPGFNDSVHQGYVNALAALEKEYHADPSARFTVAGYSQGAWVGDLVLQTIAANGTDIPRSQVDGMLWSDPMQPGTGFWRLIPRGIWLPLVAPSPGTGPLDFPGMHVRRFCIHTDGICDATSLASVPGFLNEHPRYQLPGNVMPDTIALDGLDGIVWYPSST